MAGRKVSTSSAQVDGVDLIKKMIPPKVSAEVGSGVGELYQKYACNYCMEDIPGLRVKCADCLDFDLCLPCFGCGAQIGKHKNSHKYLFMNNGGFPIYPREKVEDSRRRTSQLHHALTAAEVWNAREEMRLLDAVEQYGYGNWKDIAQYVESKQPEQAKEEYIKQYIHGLVGKHTWREDLRGQQTDHTQAADRGPLSPTLTGKLPPINVGRQEAMLLGYMPHRDDFEDFDKETENLVAQIADRSAEDEELDIALKLAQCDIYERRLREQVRRKRVARDYQLVSKFYEKNPIVTIGKGAVISPQKISNQVKAVKKGDGPKSELIEALKGITQFHTAQEFSQFVDNLCVEKELKVRVRELIKYRQHGLTKQSQLVPFEQLRFRRELKLKHRRSKGKAPPPTTARFLPTPMDYSIRAILDPFAEMKSRGEGRAGPAGVGGPGKKKKKRAKWARKKLKTGRRLLIQQGSCILTIADPKIDRRDSTESMTE